MWNATGKFSCIEKIVRRASIPPGKWKRETYGRGNASLTLILFDSITALQFCTARAHSHGGTRCAPRAKLLVDVVKQRALRKGAGRNSMSAFDEKLLGGGAGGAGPGAGDAF